MDSAALFVITFSVLVSVLATYLAFRPRTVVNKIRGPPSPSWIFGHMRQLIFTPRYGEHEFGWQKLYGPVYKIRAFFGQERLMIGDPVALQYLLNNPEVFFRAPVVNGMVTSLVGKKSVMVARGDEHRRLRAALNVGFTSAAVRSYQTVFENAAEMVSDLFDKSNAVSTNISPLLSTGTLAAITEAVLGSSIEDLGRDFVENNIRIIELTASQSDAQILAEGIAGYLPPWIWYLLMQLPTTAAKALRQQRYLTNCIGDRIVREKIDAATKGAQTDADAYSLLLNPDTPSSNKKLSAGDVAAQTAVILLAGQETTANSVAFGLLMLARLPGFQDQLRAEILGAGPRKAGYDSMPLLNALIKVVVILVSEHIGVYTTCA
ncbi:cytochrome P450 [Mycena vitilis]|nr:cytochrome P450 [Mycena vitilis]